MEINKGSFVRDQPLQIKDGDVLLKQFFGHSFGNSRFLSTSFNSCKLILLSYFLRHKLVGERSIELAELESKQVDHSLSEIGRICCKPVLIGRECFWQRDFLKVIQRSDH